MNHPSLVQLLGTTSNNVPSAADSDLIREALAHVELELRCLNAEIAQRGARDVELVRRRDVLDKNVRQMSDLLSPARRMPADIWTTIFLHCIADETPPRLTSTDAPLLLSQVCRAWRNLTLLTPRLWSHFEIVVEEDPLLESWTDRANRMSKLLALWIERSASCPLSISVTRSHYNSRAFGYCGGNPSILWDILLPHQSRWRSLHIKLPQPHVPILFQTHSPSYPLLEVVRLQCFDTPFFGLIDPPYKFNSAPLLREILLIDVPFDIRSFETNWDRLTDIDLFNPNLLHLTLNDGLSILTLGERLMRCCLGLLASMPRTSTAIVSNVGYFHLRLYPSPGTGNNQPTDLHSIGHFFNLLSMPRLQTYKVEKMTAFPWFDSFSPPFPYESFAAFLLRSMPPLKVLHLEDTVVHERDLIPSLRLTPSLERLCFRSYIDLDSHGGPTGDELLDALSVQDPVSCLVPRLESVDLLNWGKTCSARSILNFIESRSNSHQEISISKLKSFKLNSLAMSEELSPELRVAHWQTRGIDVQISHTRY
jgi:hypothetical protein